MLSAEPRARNSNLLPVKAKGEVRLRSEVSFLKSASTSTPVSMRSLPWLTYSSPLMIESTSAPRSSPRYIEMMAGGASCAPKRWSLPADATVARSKS